MSTSNMSNMSNMSNVVSMTLMIAEFIHIILHFQVLAGIGKLHTVNDLEKRRDYFILDMGTVLASCICILVRHFAVQTADIFLVTMLTSLHAGLHMFYIVKWTMGNDFFIRSIRQYSAEPRHKKRMVRDGYAMYAFNTIGTTFDIAVHLYMFVQLSK